MTTANEERQEPVDGVILKEKAEFLGKIIDKSIENVRHNRQYNKRRAARVKVATILLSGLATIFLGLQIAGAEDWLKQVAFVLGAAVTMLNALEPYFNYRALWVEHESALARLYRIKTDLDFYLKGRSAESLVYESLEVFHARHQAVWEDLSEAWIGYRKNKEAKASEHL